MFSYSFERRGKIKKGMAKARYAGRPMGKVPYGWDVGPDGHLVKNAAEQETVKRIRTWKKRGRSFAYMARLLNEDGVPSKGGGQWHPSTVRSVLRTNEHPRAGTMPLTLMQARDARAADPAHRRAEKKRLRERLRRAEKGSDPIRKLRAMADYHGKFGNPEWALRAREHLAILLPAEGSLPAQPGGETGDA